MSRNAISCLATNIGLHHQWITHDMSLCVVCITIFALNSGRSQSTHVCDLSTVGIFEADVEFEIDHFGTKMDLVSLVYER